MRTLTGTLNDDRASDGYQRRCVWLSDPGCLYASASPRLAGELENPRVVNEREATTRGLRNEGVRDGMPNRRERSAEAPGAIAA